MNVSCDVVRDPGCIIWDDEQEQHVGRVRSVPGYRDEVPVREESAYTCKDHLAEGAVFAATIIVSIIATPLVLAVSIVALPIFGMKALYDYAQHRSLYNKTLSNEGTRVKFGRIQGQDYTRRNGLELPQENINPDQIKSKRFHELMDEYPHGLNEEEERYEGYVDSPFKTEEDLAWLEIEQVRNERRLSLGFDVRMLRAFAKGLIPLIGMYWIAKAERDFHIASKMVGDEKHWWSSSAALSFHQEKLREKLGKASKADLSKEV